MPLKMTASVGMFAIVEGNVQEECAGLLAARAPVSAADRGSGQLYVLAEIVNHSLGEEQLYSEVVQSLSDAYYRFPGSITSRLQEAVREANALLLHTNSGLPRNDWLLGGVTCVVVQGEDAYVAQAGPCAMYAILKGELRRYPEISQWLQVEPHEASEMLHPTALGVRAGLQPDLLHVVVNPGDTLAVMSTTLAQVITAADMASAASQLSMDDVLYELSSCGRETDGACIVVQMRELVSDETARPPEPSCRLAESPEAQPPASQARTLPSTPMLGVLRKQSLPETETMPDFEPGQEEEEMPERQPQRRGTAAWDHIREKAPHAQKALGSAGAVVLDVLSLIPLGAVTIWEAVTGKKQGAGRATDSATRLSSPPAAGRSPATPRLPVDDEAEPRRWIPEDEAAVARRLPADTEAPLVRRRTTLPKINRLWLVPLVVIPLIAIGLVVSSWNSANARNRQVASLVTQEEERAAAATNFTDPSAKRGSLLQALDFLRQALALRPTDPDALAAEAQVNSSLDQLEGVVRVRVRMLRQYTDLPGVTATSIASDGQNVYVLDSANYRVFRHTLNGADGGLQDDAAGAVVLAQGQTVGEGIAGELMDFWYAEAAGSRVSSGLVVVSRNRTLLELDKRWGATPIRITGAELWVDPVRFRGYLGNLYVLDRGANQIWKYLPSADGYTNEPVGYFSDAQPYDTHLAVDMAIDGSVYVLSSDGTVAKFTAGAREDFQIKGMLEPLVSPGVIFTASDELVQNIYIAEAAGARVVQVKKTGEFVRQFKAAQGNFFGQLSDLYVDENGRRLYFVAGNGLYMCDLP